MFLGLLCLILVAQDTGAIAGRVTTSTTHAPIAGVAVTSHDHRAITDAGGNFRLADLPPGEYTLSFAAEGFFARRTKARTDSRVELELTPHSSISGRVTDAAGKPLGLVGVEITQAVRGTGTTWYAWHALTDRDGRYRYEALEPGAYLVAALPNAKVTEADGARRTPVRTYYPGVADRAAAGRVTLRGGTLATADIRVADAAVFTLRGMVFDDTGRKAYTTVRLVAAGFLEAPVAEAKSPNGQFEFRDVPAGDWRLIAETDYAGTVLRGSGAVFLDRHDVENVTVRLARPFAVTGSVEPAELGKDTSLELFPVDAPPAMAAFARANPDGSFELPAVYPGRYRVDVFGKQPDHYLDSIRIGEQDVLESDSVFAEGMAALRVVYKTDAGSVRGRVAECSGRPVLALPTEEGLWNFRFIRRGACDAEGRFEIGGLRPGSYSVVALDRIDETGLDDPATLRRLAAMGARARVEAARPALVELKLAAWPE